MKGRMKKGRNVRSEEVEARTTTNSNLFGLAVITHPFGPWLAWCSFACMGSTKWLLAHLLLRFAGARGACLHPRHRVLYASAAMVCRGYTQPECPIPGSLGCVSVRPGMCSPILDIHRDAQAQSLGPVFLGPKLFACGPTVVGAHTSHANTCVPRVAPYAELTNFGSRTTCYPRRLSLLKLQGGVWVLG